jgi:hypothetical protein
MAKAAAAGGAYAATQPVLQDESRLTNAALGAGAGALGYGAAKAVGAGVTRLSPSLRQSALEREAAERLLGVVDDKDKMLAALTDYAARGPSIRGTQQTLAEISDDTGLSALERVARQRSPGFRADWVAQQEANNAARVSSVERAFRGASVDDAESIALRTQQNAVPLLEKAKPQRGARTDRVARVADSILKERRGREGVERIIGNVRSKFDEPIDEATRTRNALSVIKGVQGARMSGADFDALRTAATAIRRGDMETLAALKPSSVTAQRTLKEARRMLDTNSRFVDDINGLYNVRQHIDDLLAGRTDETGLAKAARADLMKVKNALDDEMKAISPEFGDYLKRYSAGMREADQARVGAALLGRTAGPDDVAGNPRLSPAKIANAVRDLDTTVQRATGFDRAIAAKALEPEQIRAAEALKDQLDAYARVQTRGQASGSPTAQNIFDAQRFQEQLGGNELISLVGGDRANAILNIANRARAAGGNRVAQVVEEALLNPARARELINALPAGERQIAASLVGPALGTPFAVSVYGER